MEHLLKTDAAVFQAVLDNKKPYDLRFDDRGFKKGDVLTLNETKYTAEEMRNNKPLEYTRRSIRKEVAHVLKGPIYGLQNGWVILSFTPNTFNPQMKHKYIRIQLQGGGHYIEKTANILTVLDGELDGVEANRTIVLEITPVNMTDEDYSKLPEFLGH